MQKKKDKICKLHESIETLSHTLSLVRNSTFRISYLQMRRHVSEQLRFRISSSPSLFNVPFLPYQKLSSISITIHPFRSLLLLLPPPATTQDQSPKRVRQPSFRNFDSKNSFDRSWLKDISVPFDPVRPTLSFDRCESPSSLASKNGKVFRREREKRKKKTLSAFKNRMANKPQPRRN